MEINKENLGISCSEFLELAVQDYLMIDQDEIRIKSSLKHLVCSYELLLKLFILDRYGKYFLYTGFKTELVAGKTKFLPAHNRTVNQKEALNIIEKYSSPNPFSSSTEQFRILAEKRNELEHSHLSDHQKSLKHLILEGVDLIFSILDTVNLRLPLFKKNKPEITNKIQDYKREKQVLEQYWLEEERPLYGYFRCPECDSNLVCPEKQNKFSQSRLICKDCDKKFSIDEQIDLLGKSANFSITHRRILFFYYLPKQVYSTLDEKILQKLANTIVENNQVYKIVQDPDVNSVFWKVHDALDATSSRDLKNRLATLLNMDVS